MATTQTVLQGKDTAIKRELYMSFELSDKLWKVTASDGVRGPSRYTVEAGDTAAVADCVRKAKQRGKLEPPAEVHSCYEAGRDGWWLHRWLREQGIDNIWWTAPASRSIGAPGGPRPIGSTATSCWRCCCDTTPASASGRCCTSRRLRMRTRAARTANWSD